MGLSTIVRLAVSIGDRLTGGADGLQVTVSHKAVPQSGGVPVVDGYGAWDRDAVTAIERTGFWRAESRLVQGANGQEQSVVGRLVFLSGVVVHELDAITLPDGRTPPIARVDRCHDANGLYLTTVWFGATPARGVDR